MVSLWSSLRGFWSRYRRNKAAVAGLVIFGFMAVLGVFANEIAPYAPLEVVGAPFQPPLSPHFLLGSTEIGQDLFSQIVFGVRTSLTVGIFAALMATCIGVAVGGCAGFFGGKIDEVLMRTTDFFLILPSFVLALVLVSVYGRSIVIIIFVIGIVDWTGMARLTRGLFLSLKETNFVLASTMLGEKRWRILTFEILPNALSPIIAAASLEVATAILIEAGISFLGMGDPNVPSLGLILYESVGLYTVAWWLPVFPGIVLTVLVLGVNLAGDGLNDVLKVRRTI